MNFTAFQIDLYLQSTVTGSDTLYKVLTNISMLKNVSYALCITAVLELKDCVSVRFNLFKMLSGPLSSYWSIFSLSLFFKLKLKVLVSLLLQTCLLLTSNLANISVYIWLCYLVCIYICVYNCYILLVIWHFCHYIMYLLICGYSSWFKDYFA